MQIARISTLLLAAALAGPALYGAFLTHQLDVRSALLRLLLAIPVAAIMLAVVRSIADGYTKANGAKKPIRAEAVAGEPLSRRAADGA
jgi:hypothetical protein